MLFSSLHLKNVLSFRDAEIDLAPLNVVIGPNASGKSNLIEALSLLRAAPNDLAGFFRANGPAADWIWKGESNAELSPTSAHIKAVLNNPEGAQQADKQLSYVLHLEVRNDSLRVVGEKLENVQPYESHQAQPFYYFSVENGYGRVSPRRTYRDGHYPEQGGSYGETATSLTPDNYTQAQSVMSQIRDPVNFPVLTRTSKRLASTRLYRSWAVGRDSPARKPQATDGDVDFLNEDFKNLALVVNDIQTRGREAVLDSNLNRLYEAYDGIRARVYGGAIQLVANESGMSEAIPATQLSDGTMRFIALLAILCHPSPPELICIEEPEIGMHPDVMHLLANLLWEASERTQIIVTTHSPDLVDQFTEDPDVVMVCERGFDGDTQLNRLSCDRLKGWLDDYRLGQVWRKGVIGGNRW